MISGMTRMLLALMKFNSEVTSRFASIRRSRSRAGRPSLLLQLLVALPILLGHDDPKSAVLILFQRDRFSGEGLQPSH